MPLGPVADVVIIGAGPAGSSAAIALARAGRSPIVLEAKRFPREKVCGGCLSGEGVVRLQELLGPGAPLPGIPAERVSFVMGACRLQSTSHGRTRLVTRSDLDARLAEAAIREGADVRFGEPASLECSERGWVVRAVGEVWPANHILVASGTGRLVRTLGIRGRREARMMVSQRWVQPAGGRLPCLGRVELHWLRGGYVGLATPAPGLCVVATAVEAQDLGGESPLDRLRCLNPDTAVLEMMLPEHASGATGFPWQPASLGRDNLLLVGDAAGYEEPFTGDGMGQAMLSGLCAAEAILGGTDVLDRYARLMRRRHRPRLRRTRMLGRMLRWSWLNRLASIDGLPVSWVEGVVERVHVRATA